MSGEFDRYAMVDWSASNSPTGGKDSIWIGIAEREGSNVILRKSVNPRTRHEAMAIIRNHVRAAIADGKRLLLGFDFPFGYPRGAAETIGGNADWQALWTRIAALVEDRADNTSNRFEVGGNLNLGPLAAGPMFWGQPAHLAIPGLTAKKPFPYSTHIPERRICERQARGAQPVWKLAYTGSVGSQALLGISRLQALLDAPEFEGRLAIWPFQTGFTSEHPSDCVIAEIYPSIFPIVLGERSCLDEAQVETLAEGFASADARGELAAFFACPPGLSEDERGLVLREEGWILGLGNVFVPPTPTPTPTPTPPPVPSADLRPAPILPYLRDPAAIYAASFAAIRAEVDLSRLPAEAHALAIRLVHACGMPDLVDDLIVSPGAIAAGQAALTAGNTILCDAEMVAHGIIRRTLSARNKVVCRLNDDGVLPLSQEQATTRSAAQVDFWDWDLEGAVVAIGNAPTALFRLLERLDAGAPRPALILGLPVGFVGAAESKAELIRDSRGIPFVTVTGRRGGSALAAAAVNALAAGLGGGVA